jgi:hypothetical protein
MEAVRFGEMVGRLLRAEGQGRAARTVELYGWAVLVQGAAVILAPDAVASLLGVPPLGPQAESYFRFAGVWVCGIGLLYLLSGRLNSAGFVFASLLDRPLVPPTMGILWLLQIVPGPLALLSAVEDSLSWLWTLQTWRAEGASAVR